MSERTAEALERIAAALEASAPQPRFLSLADAAEMLGVTEKTIRNYIADGGLPAFRIGDRLLRVRESDVVALLVPTTLVSMTPGRDLAAVLGSLDTEAT